MSLRTITTLSHSGQTKFLPLEETVSVPSPHNGHLSPSFSASSVLAMAIELYAFKLATSSDFLSDAQNSGTCWTHLNPKAIVNFL